MVTIKIFCVADTQKINRGIKSYCRKSHQITKQGSKRRSKEPKSLRIAIR